MILRAEDDFDLRLIAESGQCFRWSRVAGGSEVGKPGGRADRGGSDCSGASGRPGGPDASGAAGTADAWRIVAGVRCICARQVGPDAIELSCTTGEFDAFWRDYLDLSQSYRAIRARVDREADPFLWEACERQAGIRILRQGPWETLVSFIISQNRNIPAIRRSIELLCEAAGDRCEDAQGHPYRAFPTPDQVSALGEDDLAACRLGYRAKYVHAAAQAVTSGDLDLASLAQAPLEEALAALTSLFGVGPKVAACVALFGLHQLDAFPVDVWVRRVLAEHYPDGWPHARYAPYSGVYQQYLFAHYRALNA